MSSPTKNQGQYVTPEQWSQVLGRAWRDAHFADALERNPIAAVREVFPNWKFERIFHVPPAPSTMSEELLERITTGEEEALMVSFSCVCVGT